MERAIGEHPLGRAEPRPRGLTLLSRLVTVPGVMRALLLALSVVGLSAGLARGEADPGKPTKPPFPYVWGTAYHIPPWTTSDESGYFSLCEGRNGRLYVGTAQYNFNSYLVEFDPRTKRQRIVLDTRRLTGSMAVGYAAQAKLHTRNFTGQSGKIYVGSKQGYRSIPGDSSEYPGGYVMTYDPKTDRAECLGMPYPKQGVIDVVADESRGLLYVVTCEDQHWMLYNVQTKAYRELGPLLTPYATTLIDSRGRANVLTKDFQVAQYDPATGKMRVRDLVLDGQKWVPEPSEPVPTWNLAADGRTAYLINMSDPALYAIDLGAEGETVPATKLGNRTAGKQPDSRNSLAIARDGRVFTLVRVLNETGFGKGYLHQLTRYSPKTGQHDILGVVVVKNPDYFDSRPLWNGKPKPFSDGFPRLPDDTMTPKHVHMSLIISRRGTLYATFLSPFTLIDLGRVR